MKRADVRKRNFFITIHPMKYNQSSVLWYDMNEINFVVESLTRKEQIKQTIGIIPSVAPHN